MSNNPWDNVPAGTPECILYLNSTPCCGCRDCILTEDRIQLSENIEIQTSVYDDGNHINAGFLFWDTRKKRLITELELHDNELGISYSELKKIINQLFLVFKPMQGRVDHSLDEYRIMEGCE